MNYKKTLFYRRGLMVLTFVWSNRVWSCAYKKDHTKDD